MLQQLRLWMLRLQKRLLTKAASLLKTSLHGNQFTHTHTHLLFFSPFVSFFFYFFILTRPPLPIKKSEWKEINKYKENAPTTIMPVYDSSFALFMYSIHSTAQLLSTSDFASPHCIPHFTPHPDTRRQPTQHNTKALTWKKRKAHTHTHTLLLIIVLSGWYSHKDSVNFFVRVVIPMSNKVFSWNMVDCKHIS